MTYVIRRRFNPNHVETGPDGGQFTSALGSLLPVGSDSLPSATRQPYTTQAELVAHAPEALQQLAEPLNDLAKTMAIRTDVPFPEALTSAQLEGPDRFMFYSIKSAERSAEKVQSDYGGHWDRLKDVVRAAVSVNNMEEMKQVIDGLYDRGLGFVERPKNRLVNPTYEGYRDILGVTRLKNGMLAEIQVQLKPMTLAKNEGHKLYEVSRSIQAKYDGERVPTARWSKEDVTTFDHAVSAQRVLYAKAWKDSLHHAQKSMASTKASSATGTILIENEGALFRGNSVSFPTEVWNPGSGWTKYTGATPKDIDWGIQVSQDDADQLMDDLSAEVSTKFNPNHVPSGEHGGEFTHSDSVTYYHGTNTNFTQFKTNDVRKGITLTTDKSLAESYAHNRVAKLGGKAVIVEATVAATKPVPVDETNDYEDLLDAAVAEGYDAVVGPTHDGPSPGHNITVADPALIHIKASTEVSQKFNPNHVPSGPTGGQFTSAGDGGSASNSTSVMFEVAPNPDDKALTKRWNALSDANKLLVSRAVAADILPGAMKALGTKGTLEDQIGGYLGDTNPSLALKIDAAHAVDAAKLLGHALSQKSMMVVSPTKAPGLNEVGAVVVHLPEGKQDIGSMTKMYDNLYKIKDGNGESVVGGYTSSHGRMVILNYSSMSTDDLATAVDKQLGGKYSVHPDTVYSSSVEKKDYLNASDSKAGGGTAPVWGKSAGDLRSAASKAIEAHLAGHEAGGTGKQKVARSAYRVTRRYNPDQARCALGKWTAAQQVTEKTITPDVNPTTYRVIYHYTLPTLPLPGKVPTSNPYDASADNTLIADETTNPALKSAEDLHPGAIRTDQWVTIKRFDNDKQIVYGEVYAPMALDTYGEFMTADDIELMAHRFMQLDLRAVIDTQHDEMANGAYPVESFIARAGDPEYTEGAWVLGVKVPDQTLWTRVKTGELNGFSFQCLVKPTSVDVEYDTVRDHMGSTELFGDHDHTYFVELDEIGNVVGGRTSKAADGHFHEIIRASVTDHAGGHTHRFFL